MPTPSSRRSSKSGAAAAASADDEYKITERREKAKSSQSYTAPYNAARRASAQQGQQDALGSVRERPRLKTRNNSAPLVHLREPDGGYGDGVDAAGAESAHPASDNMAEGQDEDEVVGVVGAVRQYEPFRNPDEVSEPLPEINIAVIGAEGVGKSTFIRDALGLTRLPASQAAECRTPIDGSLYLVRLLELPIDDVEIDDDDTVSWPDAIENKIMPHVDGAIALYDVQDKLSFEDIPEVLKAIRRASLPSVLVSAKCDTPQSERELDPKSIEQTARRSITGIGTLQTSESSKENQKKAVSMLLKTIIFGIPEHDERSASATRKRAASNAIRPVSPRPPSGLGHARASSEYTGTLRNKDQQHARHDSSLAAAYGSSHLLRIPKGVAEEEDMHRSFLFEESTSEGATSDSVRSSLDEDVAQQALGTAPSVSVLLENGATFEELVDRLLAQPTSKADSKFSAIFLALYRKFAAPGRLLEAVVERFDVLGRNGFASMITTVAQLRYLTILEQWIGHYPGDFAHPTTKRKMQDFIMKISKSRICAIAAKEMNTHMDLVQEDDDTNWAYADKDRTIDTRSSTGSNSSTLNDDHITFSFSDELSGTTLGDDKSTAATTGGDTIRSTSAVSTTSSQIIASTEAAQKAAQLLTPTPRRAITKDDWRTLLDLSDDLIARELTRMDWIMFSAIRPRDVVRHVSGSEKVRCKDLVNVTRMSDHFNYLALWVANYILLRDKPKHRALMLEKFMRIGRKLREINNYNALGAIIAGVRSSAIGRLAATRELIPPEVGKDWASLEALMSSSRSHFSYRLAWENSNTERIPYLPLHLRDLAAAEQGNATFIGAERDERVNWKKFEIMGEVVVSMQKAQGMPYKGLGGGVGGVQVKELVLDVKLEMEEDVLFQRSQQLEPSAGAAGPGDKFKQFFKR